MKKLEAFKIVSRAAARLWERYLDYKCEPDDDSVIAVLDAHMVLKDLSLQLRLEYFLETQRDRVGS